MSVEGMTGTVSLLLLRGVGLPKELWKAFGESFTPVRGEKGRLYIVLLMEQSRKNILKTARGIVRSMSRDERRWVT